MTSTSVGPSAQSTRGTGAGLPPRRSGPLRHQGNAVAGRLLVLTVLALAALYFLVPIWWLLVSASKPFGEQFEGNGLWFQGFGLFRNLELLTQQSDGIFWRWMLNSILYCVVGATLGTGLSAIAGYCIAKYRFAGRGQLFAVILAAVLIPKILFTLPLYLMFSALHLINNPLAVLLPSIVSPFGVYLSKVFAEQSIPDEVIEAGRLDGAGEFKIFRSISMRFMLPALVTIFLFQFVEIWNNYLLPAMVLSDDSLQPVTVGLVGWNASHVAVSPALVVIGSFVSVAPLVIAFLALQRFWRAGFAAGALK